MPYDYVLADDIFCVLNVEFVWKRANPFCKLLYNILWLSLREVI